MLATVPAIAQTSRGTIAGNILDSTGAAVPDAKITAREVQTGATADTVSTSTGSYRFSSLAPGSYNITVDRPGFKQAVLAGVIVQVNSTTAIDATLQPGAASDTVTVSADAPTVESETSDVGTVVTSRQVLELPLVQGGVGALRSPENFVFLTPGATGPGTASGQGGVFQSKISGGQNYATEILLDGADTQRSENGSSFDETAPSVDAFQEFKVLTSTLPADYGRTTGGIESFGIKQGTNAYHGEAFELFKNEALDANTWFNNGNIAKAGNTPAARNQFKRPLDKSNDFGGTFGGPVWIPKLYNGKDKTFFFFNLERYRDREALYAGITTVPNSAFLSGNLANNLLVTSNRNLGTDFAGRAIIQNAIYDPSTTTIDSSGRRVLNVYPNNVIQQNRFDPVSVKLLALLPKPNIGNDLFVNNFAQSGAFYKLQQIPSVKIDQNFGSNIKLSFYYATQSTDKSNGVDGLPALLSTVRIQGIRSKMTRGNFDYTISPTLLFHFSSGFQSHTNPDTVPPISSEYDNTQLGIAGSPGNGFPRFGALGDNVYGGMAVGFGPGSRNLFIGRRLSGAPSLSWV